MPVIGHAVVGLAFASYVDGASDKIDRVPFGRWAIVLVALAYTPDVVAQLGLAVGFRSAPVVSHSLAFALAAAGLLAPVLHRACATKLSHAFALALVSLVLHDGMDIAQSAGRMPLWPLSLRVDIGTWIPATLRGELFSCLPFLIIAVAWRWKRRGWRLAGSVDWASLTAVVLIVFAAATTSELRDRRQRDLRQARILAESGQFQAALEACASADRWPRPAAPGRVDYVRAMSWWGLGRIDLAEEFYLRSYRADRDYIWVVADLAALYASSPSPEEERRRKAEFWKQMLQDRFSKDPALPGIIARVQRRLEGNDK